VDEAPLCKAAKAKSQAKLAQVADGAENAKKGKQTRRGLEDLLAENAAEEKLEIEIHRNRSLGEAR